MRQWERPVMERRHCFSLYHPTVIFLYFAAVLLFCMATMEPVYVALNLTAGAVYLIFLRGWRKFFRMVAWYALMFLAVALINPLFNGLGLTVLFYLGDQPITMEAVAYGLCSGGMLLSVLIWFSCYQEVMTSDKFLFLFAKLFPTTSMMVSMIFRFVPELIRSAKAIRNAQKAMLGTEGETKKEKTFLGVRMASVLMGWSMENAMETADSMRCRGYGAAKRTSYAGFRIQKKDGWAFGIIAAMIAFHAAMLFWKAAAFRFYPRIMGWEVPWWGYTAYVFFLLFPLILEGREKAIWMRLRS